MRGDGIAFCARECDKMVERLWVRTKGKASKADIIVGVLEAPKPNENFVWLLL